MLHKQHLICLLLALGPSLSQAQTFEAASVKPAQPGGGRYTMRGGPGTSDPGRITYTNVMLRAVMLVAYDVKNWQLSVPDWFDTFRYDIAATLPAATTKEQFQAMLCDLLETRFQIRTHRETKDQPIYALVTAKNGSKIKPTAEDGSTPAELTDDRIARVQRGEGRDGFPVVNMPSSGLIVETRDGRARITAKAVPLSKFADMLVSRVGRPVFDRTGLAGNYSFELYFTPEGPNADDSAEPSIFRALQEQLGLRLEARRGPVELLVVDHAEKVPTGN
jgi:uncharacterized protein (TIGR03435 family)